MVMAWARGKRGSWDRHIQPHEVSLDQTYTTNRTGQCLALPQMRYCSRIFRELRQVLGWGTGIVLGRMSTVPSSY